MSSEPKLKYIALSQLYLGLFLITKKFPHSKIHSKYFCMLSIPGVLRKYMFQNLVLYRAYLPTNEFRNIPIC